MNLLLATQLLGWLLALLGGFQLVPRREPPICLSEPTEPLLD